MTIYFLSGLGADRRIFGRLQLPEIYRVVHLEWIGPQPRESLRHYALRMAERINTNEPFVLVGVSFGGMLASEIARSLKPAKTLLISSAATYHELPPIYRGMNRLRLDRLVPQSAYKLINRWVHWYFGAYDAGTKALLHDIIRDSDAAFNQWAVRSILRWKNDKRANKVYHIHGTDDRVLPIQYVDEDVQVKGGGHLMVWTHAKQVTAWIIQELEMF
jgi:pimeloyl-ACP methyl ester carboxylesterase